MTWLENRFDPAHMWRGIGMIGAAWALYLVYQTLYCAVFQQFVIDSAEGFAGATLWAMREWGVWLALAPAALATAEFIARKIGYTKAYGIAGVVALSLALGFRARLDLYDDRYGILASLIAHAPRNLAALGVTALGWILITSRTRQGTEPAPPSASHGPVLQTLLVMKGSGQALIEADAIDSLRSAGNYVEIDSGGQTYLMRATLNAVQKRLPERFVRIHRCHIVSIPAIARIDFHPSGNGTVIMKDGRSLGLSKSYGQALKQRR